MHSGSRLSPPVTPAPAPLVVEPASVSAGMLPLLLLLLPLLLLLQSLLLVMLMVVALLTCWWVGRVSDRPLSTIFENLALWQIHFQLFMSGIIHTRDVIFYLAITYVGLFGATRVLEARRWR